MSSRTSRADDLELGTCLAHYRVERVLGSGAMGHVYAAHDLSLDRTVALKVLRPELAEEGDFAQRFAREARAAARVSHPNLAHVYYVGEEGERRYFAMEWVEGETLQQRVDAKGPLDLRTAIDVLVQAATGLAAAHGAGVVHRDVKPSNLLLSSDGIVKVTDFGLAKSLDADSLLTAAGTLLGTPSYMSPEQCRGQQAGPASDIYCLGLVAWFLLTGRHPYHGTALGQMLIDQVSEPLPPLAKARPDLPRAVGAVIERLAAKEPEKRPNDMGEVVELLESVRPRELVPATLGMRAAAFAIDLLALAGAAAYVVGLLSLILLESPIGPSDSGEPVTEFLLTAIVALLAFLLLCVSELGWKASLGKLLLGLRVVHEDGTPARGGRTFLRYLLRVPALALFPPLGWGLAWKVILGVQALLLVANLVLILRTRDRSLADHLTGMRVVLARGKDRRSPDCHG